MLSFMHKDKGQNYIVNTAVKRYLWPTVFSVASVPIAQFIDAVILGNFLGESGLGAVSVVAPVFLILDAIQSLLSSGASTQYSIYMSRGKNKEAHEVFTLALIAAFIVSLFICVIAPFMVPALVDLLGAEGDCKIWSTQYATILLMGAPLLLITRLMAEFIQNDNEPGTSMRGALITNVTNVLLDLVFVGLFGWGASGSAYALLCGSLITFIYYLVTYKRRQARLTREIKISKLWSALKQGLPPFSLLIGSALTTFISNYVLLKYVGVSGIALNSAVNSIFCMAQYFFIGSSQSMRPLIATFFGEGDAVRHRKSALLMLRINLSISIVFGTIIIFFAKTLAQIFGITDLDLLPDIVMALRFAAIALIFDSVIFMISYYYQVIQKNLLSTMIVIMRSIVANISCIIIFTSLYGAVGLWFGRMSSFIITLIFTFIISFCLREKDKSYPLFIPKKNTDFNEFRLSIKNEKSMLTDIFEGVIKFGEEHNVEKNKLTFINILIEEIFTNTCNHGIKDSNEHYIEVLIKVENDLVMARIRDDGIPFNPLEVLVSEEIDENRLGLRIVKCLSKTQKYDRILSFNNLIVTV